MVTWIAKTALTRIRSTVVSVGALAPTHTSPMSAVQEEGQRMDQEMDQSPHCAWCALVSSPLLCGIAVGRVGLGYVILIIYYYLFINFWLYWVFDCFAQAFSGCGEQGLLFIEEHGRLVAGASFVFWSTGFRRAGFRSCCPWTRVVVAHTGLVAPRNPPRPGIRPASPALAGGFFITEPPASPVILILVQAGCLHTNKKRNEKPTNPPRTLNRATLPVFCQKLANSFCINGILYGWAVAVMVPWENGYHS